MYRNSLLERLIAASRARIVIICACCALTLAISGAVLAGPVLQAVETLTPPTIDGDMSDGCWQQAPETSDFYYTPKALKAEEKTTARICYDKQNMYVAFHCYDSKPETVKVQQTKRGGNIDVDDSVWVGIISYGTDTRKAWFGSTAGGVQAEYLPWNDGGSIQWKGDWYAAGRLVPDGYIVEMAIPFSILQYHADQTSMRVVFERDNPRLGKYWRAPDVGPNNDIALWYQWDGLRLPKPDTRPKLMTYSLLGSGEGVSSQRAGMDIKHSLTPNLIGLMTVNPYFGDVEQQVENIDFTYTEKYYSDSRPFFQEGKGYFPLENVMYTRRIESVDAGAQVYGKVGNYSLALMNVQDFGDATYSVAQIGHEWREKTDLWLCGVHGDDGTRNNFTGMICTNYQLMNTPNRKINSSATWVGSDKAAGGGFGSWFGWNVNSQGKPKTPEWSIEHHTIGRGYDPIIGYTPENDLTAWSAYVGVGDRPAEGSMDYWHVDMSTDLVRHLDGSPFHNRYAIGADVSWRNASGMGVDLSATDRPPYKDRLIGLYGYWNSRDIYRNGSARLAFGRVGGGRYLSCNVGRGWSLSRRLSVYTSARHSHIERPSPYAYSANQLVSTLAYDISNERTLAGRVVAQHGHTNCFLTYRQKVRRGTDAYLIFGDPNAESTRSSFTLKFIRLL